MKKNIIKNYIFSDYFINFTFKCLNFIFIKNMDELYLH